MPTEVMIFFESCLLGFLLGAFYDVFRIIRLSFPNGKLLIFLEDILYFALAAVASFSFIVLANGGMLRAFLLVGELLGAILYFFTLSLLIMKAAHFIIRFIHSLLRFLYRLLVKPFIRIGKWAAYKFKKTTYFFKSRYKIITFRYKKHLKRQDSVVYNKNTLSLSGEVQEEREQFPLKRGMNKGWRRKRQKDH